MRQFKRRVKASNPLKNRKFIAIFLYVSCFALFGFIAIRFSWIMVRGEIDGENLHENVENLYTRSNVIQASRGSIYDRNGNPIAVDATAYRVVATLTDQWSYETRPIHVEEPEKVAAILAEYISMSEEEIYSRLTQDRSQVEFGSAGNNLSYNIISHIEADLEEQELTGIRFEEEQTRLYPNGIFASHTIGLAQNVDSEEEEDTDNSQLTGTMGLELTYDEILKGVNGSREYQKDSFGYVLPTQEIEQVDPINGSDIQLTIDRRLQIYVENIMQEIHEVHNAERMTATVMDAKTGEILATSQRPTFNATTKDGIDQTWQNLLVEYAFEPGSTMKVMTLAAAIEEGTFRPYDTYRSGRIQVGGGVVHDFNPNGWGDITYLEGFERSSNIAFVHQVEEMGHDTWKKYLDGFGFEQTSTLGLPNEYTGSNPYEWPLQRINTSFGQGISITPIQMLRAFTAIANDGRMIEPRLVKQITNPDSGEETIFEPEYKDTPISAETAEQTRAYLENVVTSEVGTARTYAVEGYNVGAKTGTAQLVNPETGLYFTSSPDYIYSVVGMAPIDDPEVIVYVTVERPNLVDDVVVGGQVVQRIFNPVMERALEHSRSGYENIPDVQYNETPSFVDVNTHDALEEISELGLNGTLIGSGETIVQQYPAEASLLYDGQEVILLTNGAMTLPNMSGWSRNDALKVAELTGANFVFEGEGFVTEQSLAPDSFIETGDTVVVTLRSPNHDEELADSDSENQESNDDAEVEDDDSAMSESDE